jgi:hypothetical protein
LVDPKEPDKRSYSMRIVAQDQTVVDDSGDPLLGGNPAEQPWRCDGHGDVHHVQPVVQPTADLHRRGRGVR